MSKIRHAALLLTLLLFSETVLYAQFINFGQDRASLRWKQIQTEDFQLIYPDFFEKNAQKTANIFARLYRHSNSLGHKPRKISVIIHPDGGISNGNVAWAPRKSELYTMPSQQPSDSWLEHLCVHEFRHVVQLDKVNRGLTKGLYYLFGEIFPIAIVGAYLPTWFLEGDAVSFESSVGSLGRGRSPEFLNEMKAQIVEKGIYSYSKATLGSFKDHVPNRYNMGYFMTANARRHYGKDFWANTLDHVGRHPFGLTSFSSSLKRQMSGKREEIWRDSTFRSLFINADSIMQANTSKDGKQTLYRDNFAELKQVWQREAEKHHNGFDSIPVPSCKGTYADYLYPQPLADGSLIAYKKGMEESGAFVRIRDGKEEILVRTALPDDEKFALNRNRLVWSEYRPHIRWEQGGRMCLSSYDLDRQKYRTGPRGNNRFSPFQADGNWGYVETDRTNRSFIVISDFGLERELWRLEAGPDEHFIHPSYSNGLITTVVQSPAGIHLEEIDTATGKRTRLTDPCRYELDNPVPTKDGTIFRASYNGNNAFYRLLPSGKTEKLLEGRYGIRFPHYHPEEQTLYFSYYTSDGYRPGKARCKDLEPDKTLYLGHSLADEMKSQEDFHQPLVTDSVFSSRRYRKLPHLLNFHSWGPVCVDLYEPDIDFGAVVYSQNKLSSLSLTGGFIRKSGYSHGAWILNATYSGLWPVFSIDLTSGRERITDEVTAIRQPADSTVNMLIYSSMRHSEADFTVHFPFNLSSRQYNRSIRPHIRYKAEAIHDLKPHKSYTYDIKNDTLWLTRVDHRNYRFRQYDRYCQIMEYGITLQNSTRMSQRDLNPRWLQQFSFVYGQNLKHGLNLGDQWWADGRLYFPGLAPHHSVKFYGGFQTMESKMRNYGNQILYPRGISLYGYEIASIRSSYELPLWYPDRQLGALLYFKRVNTALFYDWGSSKDKRGVSRYSSFGLELSTDCHVLRLPYPVHVGIRTGYENRTKSVFADLIFGIGISI